MTTQKKKQINIKPAYLKTGDAATYLGISRRYLSQIAADGLIRRARIGTRAQLFAVDDLDRFFADRATGGAAASVNS